MTDTPKTLIEAQLWYRVFVDWNDGPGTYHCCKSLADAMLQVRSLSALGYGKDDGSSGEIQVWRITKERVQ